jgi:hypothetical protein
MAGEHFTGGVVRATLAALRHGEVACPGCGLPVDAQRDIVEELRTVTSSEPIGALVTHLRCGTPFRIEFDTNAPGPEGGPLSELAKFPVSRIARPNR